MKLENLVIQQFSSTANNYFESTIHSSGEDLKSIKKVAAHLKPNLALDLGCGGGHVSFVIAPYSHNVVAFDLSQLMIDLVGSVAFERGLKNVETKLGNVENLPFPDAIFDLIVSRYSAHHWGDVNKGLSEVARVLKKNGIFLLVDVIAPPNALCDTALQTIELLRDKSHVRDYSLLEWNRLLTANNFRINKTDSWKICLEFNSWVRRIETPENRVIALREVISKLPSEVINYFEFNSNFSFKLDVAMYETSII